MDHRPESESPPPSEETQLHISALVEDTDVDSSRAYSVELRFPHVEGGFREIRIPRGLTAKPSQVVEALLNAGAVLPDTKKERLKLVTSVLTSDHPRTFRITRRGGWANDKSFVAREWTEGPSANVLKFVPGAELETTLGLGAGNPSSWKKGLHGPCAASDFLIFAIGIAAAAPLLDIIGETEGAIFNYYGESTTGKSLAGRGLLSFHGRAEKTDPATYAITPRAVEELCFAFNDLAVFLDEEGRGPGTKDQRRAHSRSIAFTIPSGRGAVRSKRAEAIGLANLTWKALALTTGETPLEDPAGEKRAGGERVRHIDIKVPDRKLGGIFNRLKGSPQERRERAKQLAEQVERTISANHGVALRPYIQKLVENREELKVRVEQIIAGFVEAMGAASESWESRFAAKFGLVGAGVILLAEFHLAPWKKAAAKRAVMRMYRLARQSIASTEEGADAVIQQLRAALPDSSRLPAIKKGAELPTNLQKTAWGFRRKHPEHGRIVAIAPEKFVSLCGSAAAAAAIQDHLFGQNVAVRGVGGKRHTQIAVQGFDRATRSRWVVLREGALKTRASD